MCLIVDANRAAVVFSPSPGPDLQPLLDWLTRPDRDGILVFGGSLARELARVSQARRLILALQRAGRARRVPDEPLALDESALARSGLCRSDDPHVLALARVSGARTLCTEDGALHRDFSNPAIVSDPRGKIYRAARHAHLLRHTRSCGSLLPEKRFLL